MTGRYLRMVKLGDGTAMLASEIGAEVTSGVVPQFLPDESLFLGDIAFVSVSPSIEGVPANAQLFTGDNCDLLAREFVTAQRQVYQRVLDKCLRSCIWVYECPACGLADCICGGSDA